jgi:hypothetical protein
MPSTKYEIRLATILTIARIGRQLPARIKKRSRAERSSGNSEKAHVDKQCS